MNAATSPLAASWRINLAPASAAAFLAGLLNAFTINLVGAMPLSELVLIGVFAWLGLVVVLQRQWPDDLFKNRLFLTFLALQGVALIAYIVSDFYRGSSSRDMARGWARMVFLGIDIIAVGWLVHRSPLNFLLLLFGNLIGEALSASLFGALYGDLWKFGYGGLVTFGALLAGPALGATAGILAALAIAALNFALDFRSLGLLCTLIAALGIVQAVPRRARLWIAPPAALVGAFLAMLIYQQMMSGASAARGSRSNLSRTSMIEAAVQAYTESPLIGHGSWFSASDVFDNFMLIRAHKAAIAHIGGFPEANEEPGTVALHCQLLVALAEGGTFGGTFFIAYGLALLWAIGYCVLIRPWSPLGLIYLMSLLSALWNLALSPFSGSHRVLIALAVGLILLLRHESRGELAVLEKEAT